MNLNAVECLICFRALMNVNTLAVKMDSTTKNQAISGKVLCPMVIIEIFHQIKTRWKCVMSPITTTTTNNNNKTNKKSRKIFLFTIVKHCEAF